MNIKQALTNIGFSENQVKAYVSLLGLGPASAYKIAKHAGLPRSTVYEVLGSLSKQGFVSGYLKNKIQYYNAESPENILDIIEQKKNTVNQILPQLQAIYGRAEKKPIVRFYEGKDAVNNILNEFLREGKELWSFSSTEELHVLGTEFKNYLEKRIKKSIPVKVIMNESSVAYERQALGPSELREVRILPKGYQHHDLIFIWNNKVAMFTLKKHYSVLVTESDIIAGFYKTMFQFTWDTLA